MNTEKNTPKTMSPETDIPSPAIILSGPSVTLEEMMDCREKRAAIQNALLQQYHTPLICFCMNIPGPVKTSPEISVAFNAGRKALFDSLHSCGAAIREQLEFHSHTGDELILCVELSPEKAKKMTTSIEETHPFGRLFDMDVITADGEKLSRPFFRKCLLCDRQAQECARARTHSVREMQEKIVLSLLPFL